MRSLTVIIVFALSSLFKCTNESKPMPVSGYELQKTDSIQLLMYEFEIRKKYVEGSDTLTNEEVDSIFYSDDGREMGEISIANAKVIYAPDSALKIFIVETQGCGAYCNPDYYAWIHYFLKGRKKSGTVPFTDVTRIHVLPDGKYLVILSSWGRPASVYTVECQSAQLLSFLKDTFLIEPIFYKGDTNFYDNEFGFCQQSGVDLDSLPFIKYDLNTRQLTYLFANNYLYSKGLDIDTIRWGAFEYRDGKFILPNESTRVIDRTKED